MKHVNFKKLYKVKYADTVDGGLAMHQRSYKDHLVDEWLKENCEYGYYHSPGYLKEKFIEFENKNEAFIFAMRWS
jgi:hypothetical protein